VCALPILEWAGVALISQILTVIGGGQRVDLGGLIHPGVVSGAETLVGGSLEVLMHLLIVGLKLCPGIVHNPVFVSAGEHCADGADNSSPALGVEGFQFLLQVVRDGIGLKGALQNGHSPVPLSTAVDGQLAVLGRVAGIQNPGQGLYPEGTLRPQGQLVLAVRLSVEGVDAVVPGLRLSEVGLKDLSVALLVKQKLSKYFSRKTYSKYSRRVRITAPPDVAWLNTEILCITHLYIYSNIYDPNASIFQQFYISTVFIVSTVKVSTTNNINAI
jgi:hypothetical protein